MKVNTCPNCKGNNVGYVASEEANYCGDCGWTDKTMKPRKSLFGKKPPSQPPNPPIQKNGMSIEEFREIQVRYYEDQQAIELAELEEVQRIADAITVIANILVRETDEKRLDKTE